MSTESYQAVRVDEQGVMRIGQTRVTLDVVVESFKMGKSAEEIALEFPAMTLAEVYGALAHYLSNREAIEAYIQAGLLKSDTELAQIAGMQSNRQIREKLIGLRQRRESA